VERQAATAESGVAPLNGGREPRTAKRVRHTFLVSEKGVAAARRRLEPGKCVIRCERVFRMPSPLTPAKLRLGTNLRARQIGGNADRIIVTFLNLL